MRDILLSCFHGATHIMRVQERLADVKREAFQLDRQAAVDDMR